MSSDLSQNGVTKVIPLLINFSQSKFFRYLMGGALAACVHLSIVAIAVEFFDIDKENANSLGFVVGVLVNYFFQRRFTFREYARGHAEQLPLFAGFALVGLGINRYVYSHGIHDFHLQYMIAAITAIGVVFVFNFTANSLITFRARESEG